MERDADSKRNPRSLRWGDFFVTLYYKVTFYNNNNQMYKKTIPTKLFIQYFFAYVRQ